MKKAMTIIMITTSDCNIQCVYCYSRASRRNIKKFGIKNIRTMIRNASVGFDSVEFCWHGGEPLLVGKDFYQEAINAQKVETEKRGVVYHNNIQTNGLLLDTSWIDFLQRNNFHVGISLDAPTDVYVTHRRSAVNALLKTCAEIKTAGMPLGVLCVVSKLNVCRAEEIFHFYKIIGVNSFGLLPLKSVPLSERPIMPTNDEMFAFYRNMFDLWARTENSFSSVEPLDTMMRSLLGQRPRGCSFANSCLKKMITIDQEGNIVPCGSLVEDQFMLGNILAQPLINTLAGAKTRALAEVRTGHNAEKCGRCEYTALCRGGCRADSYWATGNYGGGYPFCETRKKTFDYIKLFLKNVSAIQQAT